MIDTVNPMLLTLLDKEYTSYLIRTTLVRWADHAYRMNKALTPAFARFTEDEDYSLIRELQ